MLVQEFVERILAHMGVENFEVTIEENDEFIQVQITVSDQDSGLLIGYHGEVLTAIQQIVQVIFRRDEAAKKIVVNVNDYKQRREAQLKEMTLRIIDRVIESQQPYVFAYLPANERLVVHQAVSEHPDADQVESISSGEGHQRRLQIRLRQEAASEKPVATDVSTAE